SPPTVGKVRVPGPGIPATGTSRRLNADRCQRQRPQEVQMPRLRMVPRSELHPFGEVMFGILFGDRDPIDDPGTPSGTPGDWWPVFANSPECFDHCCSGFQYYRSPNRKLDPKLRELGQTRTGWARGSSFVYSQH